MMKRKRVPMRTCVSCGLKTAKRDLLRVVSPPDGGAVVDEKGKLNGRGAYVCQSCGRSPNALRRGRLQYALRTNITTDDWKALTEAVAAAASEA